MNRMAWTTEVTARVVLANGGVRTWVWNTPIPFGRCIGKGSKWAREELRKQKIPGRSHIREIAVTIRRRDKRWHEMTENE